MTATTLSISPARFDAVIFDLDGVVTQTARVHAAAWKHLFDDFLRQHAAETGTPFRPFDEVGDYLTYVDGKPRYDGVQSFLASRGIHLPWGSPSDGAEARTVCGLGNRKNEMLREAIEIHGVRAYESTINLIRAGLKLAAFIPKHSQSKVGDALKEANRGHLNAIEPLGQLNSLR